MIFIYYSFILDSPSLYMWVFCVKCCVQLKKIKYSKVYLEDYQSRFRRILFNDTERHFEQTTLLQQHLWTESKVYTPHVHTCTHHVCGGL